MTGMPRAGDTPAVPPPRRPQLNDEAAAYVRELIMTGQVQPGDFVRLDQIARDLGISTTPVREGLLALRGEGFIRLEPRRGFVVAPLSTKDIRDIFVAQATLAGELAARAATAMTRTDHRTLSGLQAALEAAAASGEIARLEALNHAFHRLINRAADAPKVAWLLSVGARYVPRRFYATITGWPDASARDHAAIIDALAARDADQARESMSSHVRHAGELLAQHLERLAKTTG